MLLLSKSVINACLFLANDLGHDTPKFTDSRGETSDFRPPSQPFLQRDFANVEATWSLANKGRKVQKEGHVHLLLMGLKIFYLGKVTARQE